MEFRNDQPIYLQIMNDIKMDIVSGKIAPGDKLLSTRDLALAIKVNPNTIQRVYKELEAEEICFTKRGMGTYVTEDEAVIQKTKEELADKMVEDFVTGMKKINYSVDAIIRKIKNDKEGEA